MKNSFSVWQNTLCCLMQVPENGAAAGLADAVVQAWKLYGSSELVC